MNSLIGIELDNGGVLLKFVATAAETGGARHVVEARYLTRMSLPPPHCHPAQNERFSVVTGALHFRVEGKDQVARAGDVVDIEKGAFHSIHNPDDAEALVVWETRPALRTGEFLFKMNRAGLGRARPRLVDAAAILNEYRPEIRVGKPSALVQRIVFACLAPFGRRALAPITR